MPQADVRAAADRRPGLRVLAMLSDRDGPTRVHAIVYPAGAAVAASYLQPGVSTVWPGGWHFAPPSCGPFLLLPGPKSGSAKAGAAVMDRAPTARMDASACAA